MSVLSPTWPSVYGLHRPVSASEARILDRRATSEFGIPSLVLMEHASRGVAEIAARMARGRILVCCGPGNNGGDGYGAARFLRGWGRDVRVLQLSQTNPGSADAALEARLAEEAGPVERIFEAPQELDRALADGPALVVDALFGVGLSRPLEGPYVAWIEALNAAGVPVLAVDVPSGMDADSGLPLPVAVQARVTATMAAPKRGFARGAPGAALAGHVVEVDIGLPRSLLAPLELASDS